MRAVTAGVAGSVFGYIAPRNQSGVRNPMITEINRSALLLYPAHSMFALVNDIEFPERPTAVIIKHNTPCGVACDENLVTARSLLAMKASSFFAPSGVNWSL